MEDIRSIPREIKKPSTLGFLQTKYTHREVQTCPSWAKKNLCRYGSDCVRAHYYFPTIVWRAHRVGQQTSPCREWKEQRDVLERRKMTAIAADEVAELDRNDISDSRDHQNDMYEVYAHKSNVSRVEDQAGQVAGCAFSIEVCGYAHAGEESEEVHGRVDVIKKMSFLPYRAVAMLECKGCGMLFREVEDILQHGRQTGHFEDAASVVSKAEKWQKLAQSWRK